MIRTLLAHFRRPTPNPLHEARAAWQKARAEYRSAKERGDTRSMNLASRHVRSAATVLVRMELGR